MFLIASFNHCLDGTVKATRCCIALSISLAGNTPKTKILAVIPCILSSIASSNVATAKNVAPFSIK